MREVQFFYCNKCDSSGSNERGYKCKECGGIGVGSFIFDHLLCMMAPISKSNIFLRRLGKTLFLVLDILSWIIVFVGFSSLVYYFLNTTGTEIVEVLKFWEKSSIFILVFFFGLFSLLFTIYRFSRRKYSLNKIKRIRTKKDFNIPNNWKELRRYHKNIDVSIALKDKTLELLENAYLLAFNSKHKEVSVTHLFMALLKSKKIVILLARLNIDINLLKEKINNQLLKKEGGLKKESDLKLSKKIKEILIEGFNEAYLLKQKHITVLNLINNCIEKDEMLKEILLDFKVDKDKIKNTIEWFRINDKQLENYKVYKKLAHLKPGHSMDKAYTAVATPFLNSFGYDLTLAAKWGRLGICIARDKEIELIFDSMKSGKNGIIITGEAGVGKKTIIEGVASLMVTEDVPDFLKDKRLIELDITRLISGASPSEAEERLLRIIDEINKAGNIILYIKDLENLIGISAGSEESLELSEVLANALDRKALYLLSSASNSNYRKYIEKIAIGDILDRIIIKEPVGNQVIRMLESKIGAIEAKHKVFFSYNAIETSVELSSRFIHNKYLPEKAITILEKTAVAKASSAKNSGNMCDGNDVAKIVHLLTDIPVSELEDNETEKLLHLEDDIHKTMINQNEAVNVVANSLRRARTQLRSGTRPIASFLFMGPTGVGKTELAKTITKVYFKNKDYLIRLDMSEYQHEDSVSKMIGGNGRMGYLTEAVKQKPFSLILLDELEKAHPKIFNLFLQVMDDGRLTDGDGNTIDFTNTIIIATSNAGSLYIQEEVKKGTKIEAIKETLINEHLNKVMRPELINRFDGIVVFKPLSRQNIADITKLMLGGISKMLDEKGIFFEFTDKGVLKIAEEGYDPKFGARPLRRVIQKRVENEIAKQLLGGQIRRRDTIIINDNAEIEIKKAISL